MLEVRPFSQGDKRFLAMLARDGGGGANMEEMDALAGETIRKIRSGGGEALTEICGLPPEKWRVTRDELSAARNDVSEQFLTSLSLARVNIRKFHENQRRLGFIHDDRDGVCLQRRTRALKRVGICCGSSFSALLLHAVPAQVAGVGQICVAAQTGPDGEIDPHVLATAKVLGLEEVYRLGGAAAVAAFAYGVEPVGRVDKIVGPGGSEVEAAKRLVAGCVGADFGLGLGELVIVADGEAKAKLIARDFLAQAEHDRNAHLLVLLTDDRILAEAVRIELECLAEKIPDGARLLEQIGRTATLYLCSGIPEAMKVANVLAPARLVLQTRDNHFYLGEVETAGAVFLGPWSGEAAGDGFAGLNPYLPMGGTARFNSGLGVESFTRDISVVEYAPEKLLRTGRHVAVLAEKENRVARVETVKERLEIIRKTVDC